MIKDIYLRQYAEHELQQKKPIRVTLAADRIIGRFNHGEKIRLAIKNGKYCLINEQQNMVPADIYINVAEKDAWKLSLAQAAFTVTQTEGTVLKAEMKSPLSMVHHGETDWCFLQ